jgi:pimeloyl-ACP methyl ester carboxylesterase
VDGRPRTTRSRRLRRWLAAPACLLIVLPACSGSDGSSGRGGRAGGTATTTPPERFTGSVEDFYRVPDPLPEGEPGQLVRVQEVSADDDASTTLRVMYHSRDAGDRDRAATGIVTYPNGPAPDGGWPVVSWSHGTTGLAAQCAPSRDGEAAPAFGVEGVAVATDYVGLGPVGEVHPYFSKASEGNAAIDAVRAARNLPEAHAGTRWLSIGHSQGGHAALAAAELSADHAPELELLGTVAWAPGSDLDMVFGGIDPIVTRIISAMVLYGGAAEHPEIQPEDFAGPDLEAAADVVTGECLDAITAALAPIPADRFWDVDPREAEPARSLLVEGNEVGTVRVDAPLLVVSGTADDRVVIDRVRTLFGRLCDIGQVTELVVVEGAGHGDVIPRTSDQVEAWLAARLTGEPATDSCATAPA